MHCPTIDHAAPGCLSTVQIVQDLASGYMSGKLLLKLEAVGFMLCHHTSQYYTFLDHPANSRNRTM